METGELVMWASENPGHLDVKNIKIEQKEINDWPDLDVKPRSLVPWKLESTGQESLDMKPCLPKPWELENCRQKSLDVKPSLQESWRLKNSGQESLDVKLCFPKPWELENSGKDSFDVKDNKTEQKGILPINNFNSKVTLSLMPFVKLERKYEIENAVNADNKAKLQIKQELDDKLSNFESKLMLENSKELIHEPIEQVFFPTFYICKKCDQCFEERIKLEEHGCLHIEKENGNTLRKVKNKNITRQKSFKNVVDEEIVIRERQIKLLICHLCSETFTVKEDLVIHLKHHTEFKYRDKKYVCNECGKRFWHKPEMVNHPCMTPKNKRNWFRCDICDNISRTALGVQIHQRIHYIANPWSCTHCGKSFPRLSHLLDHENVHIGDKPYKCRYCDKHFRQNTHRNTHERIHKNIKPYSCRQCGKSYSDKRNLVTHELTHSGARPYKCDKCEKAFTQKSHLNTHRVIHSNERKYTCEVCGAKFKQRLTLKSHIYLHMDVKPYNCKDCKRAFSQPTAFRRHVCHYSSDV